MSVLVQWVCYAIALSLVGVGALALVSPCELARLYGVEVSDERAHGFVRATGVRDAILGFVLGVAAYVRDVPVVVAIAAAGIVLSIADFVIAYHHGGRRLRVQHGAHASGVVAFVLVLAMVLFAFGR